MKLSFSRVDATLPLPTYQTTGAVAFDLYSREDLTVAPKGLALIPANFIIRIPPGYALIIASRSSTPIKKGLTLGNGIGVIDQDYCGPKDELKVQVYNLTDASVTVARGERIAQALIMPIERCELVEEKMEETAVSRGGFGTTG